MSTKTKIAALATLVTLIAAPALAGRFFVSTLKSPLPTGPLPQRVPVVKTKVPSSMKRPSTTLPTGG